MSNMMTMTNTRRQFLGHMGATAALGTLSPLAALAQTIEQVKIFYGFPAGSSGDSVARRVGEKLAGSAYTRNSAVVENKPGAGGRIALESLKGAAADGSVVVLKGLSDATGASITLSGQAARGLSVAVGTVVGVVAISTGHILVLSGKAIAFIPNEIGKSLLHHSEV